ncbi:SinI family autotransporter-associated protein [Escherichia coli]|uniref:SinI family autotransporter-associated protein n=1 Tax=Escherichia coli TaxID=562 RepID=UPI00148ED1B6|nr:SinI family autotransporter-associated protein [Escherichia coli]QJU27431.1 hypothetical protein HLY11_20350 [Escherichia coli]HBE6261396.1 hypothetical protein [Escherichia coli]
MKQDKRRGLTRIALALALAGYCVTPLALAEDSAWIDSGETNIFQGTIPWLYPVDEDEVTGAGRVTLTSDYKGTRPSGSTSDKRMYSGDKLTLSWVIGDTEGDVDLGTAGKDAKTIDTIRWMSYKDAQGGDPKELATKVTTYTLTDADRGRYIGIEITPTTQTGTPYVGTALHLYDVSNANGGGSDKDNVDPGPVVNQNLKVAIFVKDTSTNLINGSTPIQLGKTYVAKLYSDENKNGQYDAGTDVDVTANYDFRWVLSDTSDQLGTGGGIVNSSFDNQNLVIPATNDEARTNLNGPARDGKDALAIPTNGDGVQGYKLQIIYKHK